MVTLKKKLSCPRSIGVGALLRDSLLLARSRCLQATGVRTNGRTDGRTNQRARTRANAGRMQLEGQAWELIIYDTHREPFAIWFADKIGLG